MVVILGRLDRGCEEVRTNGDENGKVDVRYFFE